MAVFNDQYGCIFNIQRYSLHDGPGIRTLVFLKGCPLRCSWCSNPESQYSHRELAYNSQKCIGIESCGRCMRACPQEAIEPVEENKIRIDRKKCQECFTCSEACPTKAFSVFGVKMSVDEVLNVVEEDSLFYARSGGGITISGGEPLMQGEFSYALLSEAKKRRIKTAMETCGFADWEKLAQACSVLDHILYDIKCIDPDKHEKFTGVRNNVILDNFNKVCDHFPDLPKLVRTPLIAGFNDTEADVRKIVGFIKGKPNVGYELLPGHHLGKPKYEYLGRKYSMTDSLLTDSRVKALQELAK